LCAIWSNTNTNTDREPNPNADREPNPNAYAMHREMCTHAAAPFHPGTSPVAAVGTTPVQLTQRRDLAKG
jgi:hypothetical protein